MPEIDAAYRAGLAEGFRRGRDASMKACTIMLGDVSCYRLTGHECYDAIRALRPEGEKT